MSRAFALCIVVSLVSCLGKLPIPEESWRMTGKLSVQTATESRILGIDWIHRAGNNSISLRGPLGVRVALIKTEGDELIMTTGEVAITYDKNNWIDEFGLEKLILPWHRLEEWVRLGETGTSEFGEWQFQITEMSAEGPIRMRLEHPKISLKLKVNRWSLL